MKKSCEPGTSASDGQEGRCSEDVLRASGVPVLEAVEIDVEVSTARSCVGGTPAGPKAEGACREASPVWLPPDRGAAAPGGWTVGKRHVQKLRRAGGLRVPPTKRKIVRRGRSTVLPTKAEHRGHVWTWDFISDATTRGGALRMLTILDECTRECHVLRADRALKSADVLEWMGKAIADRTRWPRAAAAAGPPRPPRD